MNTTRPFSEVWHYVVFVTFMFFCNYMARSTLSPLLAYIELDLQISHSQSTSWLLAQGLGFASTQIFTGYLVSVIRPRYVVAFSTILLGSTFLLIPFLGNFYALCVLFFCFGMFCGAYLGAGIAVLGTLVSKEDWGKAIGIHELGPNVGFIVIPILAQGVLLFASWQAVFVLVGLLSVAAGISFFFFGKGGYTFSEKPSLKSNFSLLKQRNTWVFCLLVTVGLCGEFSVYSVLQIFLVSEHNFSPDNANMWLLLSRLLTPAAVIIGGIASDRFSSATIIIIGAFVHAVSLVFMGFAPSSTLMLVGVNIQPLCIGFIFPAIFTLINEHVHILKQPALLSMIMPLSALVGAGLMPFILGVCGQYFNFGVGFVLVALLSLLCIGALFVMDKTENATQPPVFT